MKLGIMFPNVLTPNLDDLPKIGEYGARVVQARPETFCDEQMRLTPEGKQMLQSLERVGVKIAAWCAYRPLIGAQDDVDRNVAHQSRVIELAREAHALAGAQARPLVLSESGNPSQFKELTYDSMWQQVREATQRLAEHAEKNEAFFGFEPTRSNILDSSATAARLMSEVGSDRIRVCFDPANTVGDKDTLEGAVETLRPHMAIAHAKDVILGGEKPVYPPAGKGSLDYPKIFELLQTVPACEEIIIEYVRTPEQARETIDFLAPFCTP